MNKLEIDSREVAIINKLKNDTNFVEENVIIKSLPLGDFIIGDIIIERKSLNDLISSILDGRYKEQSNRLIQCLGEYKVYYFIEGDMDTSLFLFNNSSNSISKSTIISCIYSLTYEKGMNVLLTKDIDDTIFYIKQFHKKNNITRKSNSSNISKSKSTSINTENISKIMLSQIPYVSDMTCEIIFSKFKNIKELIYAIGEDNEILNNLTIDKDGKQKKINKKAVQNILHYLDFLTS